MATLDVGVDTHRFAQSDSQPVCYSNNMFKWAICCKSHKSVLVYTEECGFKKLSITVSRPQSIPVEAHQQDDIVILREGIEGSQLNLSCTSQVL
jgi:hypothetical protein